MGGAAGHMKHPFDLQKIENGKDLTKFFKAVTKSLSRYERAYVKIDGINASVRLNEDNVFVIDRGSSKELDIKGVTKNDLLERFGEGHGFLKIGPTVLDIFNKDIENIQPELEKLGVWGNPNKMLNIEYVEGTTNVIENNKKFLAIHGLLKIENTCNKSNIKITKRTTHEIPYDRKVMERLVEKLNVISKDWGFEVYTQFPVTLDRQPDYKKILDEKITIDGRTKSLRWWFWKYRKSFDKSSSIYKEGEGEVGAMSKAVMIDVLKGLCLDNVYSKTDARIAISATLLYYGTMRFGEELLSCLDSELGRCDSQEGIVIRNSELTGIEGPCKITGKFILSGMSSNFRKR